MRNNTQHLVEEEMKEMSADSGVAETAYFLAG